MFKVLGDSDICTRSVIDVNTYVCWNDGLISFDVGFNSDSVVFLKSLVFTNRKKLMVGFDGICVIFCYIARGSVGNYSVEYV